MRLLLALVFTSLSLFNLLAQDVFTAFSKGNRWDYNATGAELTLVINTPFFSDNPLFYVEDDWQTNRAPFGYNHPMTQTTIPFGADSSDKVITTYFMTDDVLFSHAADQIDNMYLDVLYEDGFVAYLNGIEIARKNLTPLVHTSNTEAQEPRNTSTYERIDVSNFKNFISPIAYLDNILVVEIHKANPEKSSLIFDCELIYTTGSSFNLFPAVVIGPYLNMGTPNSAVVKWETNVPTTTELSYGTDSNTEQTYFDATLTKHHEVVLTKLLPNTQYFYNIEGIESFFNLTQAQYFYTAPEEDSEQAMRIWVTGDFGNGLPTQHLVYLDYLARNGTNKTDFWMWLGDNAYDKGTYSEYRNNVFNIYGPTLRNHMVWPSLGNHDVDACETLIDKGPYFDFFTLPKNGEAGGAPSGTEAYYSFNYGNAHFICLESTDNNRMPSGDMLKWLKRDLNQNTKKWTVAFWHHPPYSKGSHDSDDEGILIEMRENALPILEKMGVDLVLTGHSHDYERSYFIDGHYGKSDSFDATAHILNDELSGNEGEVYEKPKPQSSHYGTVYAVVGASGSIYTEGGLDHPANFFNSMLCGSMMLEISGDTLKAEYWNIDHLPTNADEFYIIKKDTVLPCVNSLDLPETVSVCDGTPVTLSVHDAMKVNWSNGSIDTSITVTSAGTYTVKVTEHEGCEFLDSTIVLAPSIAFNLPNNSRFCEGDSLLLSNTSTFPSYSWNTGDTTAQIWVKTGGNYTLTATTDTGCVAEKSITIVEIPVVEAKMHISYTSTFLSPFDSLRFIDQTPFSLSRTWNFGDSSSSNDSIAYKFYTSPGVYSVQLLSNNGACQQEKTYDLEINEVVSKIDIQTSAKWSITPNPNTGSFTINHSIAANYISLVDLTGKDVKCNITTSHNQTEVAIIKPSPGVYLLRVNQGNQHSLHKVVIKP